MIKQRPRNHTAHLTSSFKIKQQKASSETGETRLSGF